MSLKKILKKAKKRKAVALANHLEHFGAAFCREVGVQPSDAILISKPIEGGGTSYVWERRKEKVDMNELHPDIKVVFDAAFRKVWGPEMTEEDDKKLAEVMEKYREGYESEKEKK